MLSKDNEMVEFQKELDKQFMEIYEQRKRGETSIASNEHGLIESIDDVRLFLPLKVLRSIGSETNYEVLPLMSNWVIGYNQMQGDLYTIVDLENIVRSILGKVEKDNKSITQEDNIIYLRDKSITNVAVTTKNINMYYSGDYTEIVRSQNENNEEYAWIIMDEKNYKNVFKKENMSIDEYEIIQAVYDLAKKNKVDGYLSTEELNNIIEASDNKYKKLVVTLIGNIYVDESGKKPIFSIDISRFVKYLLSLGAY